MPGKTLDKVYHSRDIYRMARLEGHTTNKDSRLIIYELPIPKLEAVGLKFTGSLQVDLNHIIQSLSPAEMPAFLN